MECSGDTCGCVNVHYHYMSTDRHDEWIMSHNTPMRTSNDSTGHHPWTSFMKVQLSELHSTIKLCMWFMMSHFHRALMSIVVYLVHVRLCSEVFYTLLFESQSSAYAQRLNVFVVRWTPEGTPCVRNLQDKHGHNCRWLSLEQGRSTALQHIVGSQQGIAVEGGGNLCNNKRKNGQSLPPVHSVGQLAVRNQYSSVNAVYCEDAGPQMESTREGLSAWSNASTPQSRACIPIPAWPPEPSWPSHFLSHNHCLRPRGDRARTDLNTCPPNPTNRCLLRWNCCTWMMETKWMKWIGNENIVLECGMCRQSGPAGRSK